MSDVDDVITSDDVIFPDKLTNSGIQTLFLRNPKNQNFRKKLFEIEKKLENGISIPKLHSIFRNFLRVDSPTLSLNFVFEIS